MAEISDVPNVMQAPGVTRKSLILCFDGTGNKFSGTAADSNIVKIYSFLDRQDASQFHYYQPGIGTYVETSSLSRKSRIGRIRSWYVKAKDQAVGHSFAEHVMAGYKFLMRFYSPGDDIYFFGFSRGSYTARFLAQMLDYVGLLSTGNEEMLRFAWKTFARWQSRSGGSTKKERDERHKMDEFMETFRETFSRPIDRIRFVGLFDCVNSVPQFEAAWMGRTKFPYTARSSARVIRHAVSIDERRAKFRQDLVSGQKMPQEHSHAHNPLEHLHLHHHGREDQVQGHTSVQEKSDRPNMKRQSSPTMTRFSPSGRHHQALRPASSAASQISVESNQVVRDKVDGRAADEDAEQDVLEVWFGGEHSNIGGGWPGESRPASDLPLIWMLREARRAGLPVDEAKLQNYYVQLDDVTRSNGTVLREGLDLPQLEVEGKPVLQRPDRGRNEDADEILLQLSTKTRLHDSLTFGGGLSWGGVCAWKIMEHLPFRRMDLQPDGSWKPISWPLPRGEVRDVPKNAIIHSSVLRRMQADENYRPGNVIVGGGGRGVRKAPKEAGMGQWQVVREQGSLIGECVMRADAVPKDEKHQ